MIRSVLECAQDGYGNLTGAHFNHQDMFGKTALHWAVKHHEPIMVEILLEKGADCSIEDQGGNFAWELKNWNGDKLYVDLARTVSEKAFEQLQTPFKAEEEWGNSGWFTRERDDANIMERLGVFAQELQEFGTAAA